MSAVYTDGPRQVLLGLKASSLVAVAYIRVPSDFLARSLPPSIRWMARFDFIVPLTLGLTMIQVEEYAAAIFCWLALAVVLFAKVIGWHMRRVEMKTVLALGVAALFVFMTIWTDLKRVDKPWSVMVRGPKRSAVVPPRPSETSLEFESPVVLGGIPVQPNTTVTIRQVIINRGPEPARSVLWAFDILPLEFAPSAEAEKRAWSAFIERVKLSPMRETENDLAHGNRRTVDRSTPPLLPVDIAAIQEGRLYLYVAGIALYRDRHGELQSEMCLYLQPPLSWYRCESHNVVGRESQFR